MLVLPSPSVSLILALFYSLFVSFLPASAPVLPLLIIPVLSFLFFGLKKRVLKSMLGINLFLILIFASYVYSGKTELAVSNLIRSNMIILFILSLFCEVSGAHIAIAAARLRLPYKLVVVLFLAIKFIEHFFSDLTLFKTRLKARGLKPGTNTITYKAYASFVALLVFMGLKRASAARECMIARNFNLNALKIGTKEIGAKEVLWGVLLIAIIIWEILWIY